MLTSLGLAVLVLLALQAVLVALVSAIRPKANIYVTIVLVSVLTAPLALLYGTQHGGKTMITSRLEQLSAGRFVDISGDRRIVLTGKGRAFGRFVTAGRKLFGIASAN